MDLNEEYKYFKEGCQDDGARLFGGAQQQMFYLKVRKDFITVRLRAHWKRLNREAVESSPWRSSKQNLDMVKVLTTSTILRFCDSVKIVCEDNAVREQQTSHN